MRGFPVPRRCSGGGNVVVEVRSHRRSLAGMTISPDICCTALEGLLPADALGMRGLGIQGLFEPGVGGFLLGFTLRLFTARLHRAGGLERAGLLGEPDIAEVALADVGE